MSWRTYAFSLCSASCVVLTTLAPSLSSAALPLSSHMSPARQHISDSLPPPPPNLQSIGFLRPSFYWIALETDDGEKRAKRLLDPDGNLLATVSEKYFKSLSMEGTGRLLDGRVINFKLRLTNPDGSKEIRWRICGPDAPFGYGYEDALLREFRSVAVDPTVIPLGSKVYIPAARGVKLPDGSTHDGVFDAVDIGDLIQNKKIDIFTSFGDQSSVFERSGLETGKNVEIFLVK